MNITDIKERLVDSVKSQWSQFTESTTYIELKEKYDGMNPPMQLAVRAGALLVVLLLLTWIPLSFMSSADERMNEFFSNKEVLRDLLRVQRDKGQAPQVPPTPIASQIKLQITDAITRAGLAPTQILENIETTIRDDKSTQLIPSHIIQQGIQVTLLKLNLKQVVDLAHSFQSINPAVKMTAMDMKASAQNDHYFDVMFRLVGFDAPRAAPLTGGGDSKPKPKGRGK